jgi:hypothetical protein
MGAMAQCEQTTIYYDVAAEEINGYSDLASSMTAANRKQYHQVATDGTALCYRILVTAIKGQISISHLQNQFATCNAVKQTTAGWKAQLRHAGVKLKDLPPYGRRPRFALETGSYVKNGVAISGETIYEISSTHLSPMMKPGGDAFFGNYTATDGNAVYYKALATPAAGSFAANMLTQVTVTDGAGTETQNVLVMVGDDVGGEFNVITNYMKARRQTPDVSIDTPGPEGTSEMLNLFSIAEEMSDDIIEGVDEYMDWKPYTPDTASNAKFDHLTEGCLIDAATSATTQYPPSSAIVDVPLGLFKIGATTGDSFRVDVLAIYEM